MRILSKKMALTSILLIFATYVLVGCGSTTTPSSTQPSQQESAKTNTYGNTSGNLANSSYVAQQGDWIYFGCLNDYGKTAELKLAELDAAKIGSLYKMRTDGTEKTELVNGFKGSEINVIGDWIYYLKRISGENFLYKIRTDGTDERSISSNKAAGINVVGDWIYYSNLSDKGYLYKMHTDGKDDTKLNNVYSSNINVAGDWIYYLTTIGDRIHDFGINNNAIYKIRTDGTNETKIISSSGNSETYSGMTVVGDWIYYSDVVIDSEAINSADLADPAFLAAQAATTEETLYKIRTDGTGGKEPISNTIDLFNVNGDWIYYTDKYRKIYKIHSDGTGNTKIEADNLGTINVLGDWIYYLNRSDSASLYRIRTDGTQNQKLQ